jgi:hypothetical protein
MLREWPKGPLVSMYCTGGGRWQRDCEIHKTAWGIDDCNNGYRRAASARNAESLGGWDCQGQGSDTTPEQELECLRLYVPAVRGEYPDRPWVAIWIDNDMGHVAEQYAIYSGIPAGLIGYMPDEWQCSRDDCRTWLAHADAETEQYLGKRVPWLLVQGDLRWSDGWREAPIVGIEAYAMTCDLDELRSRVRAQAAMLEPGQRLAIVVQDYDRNGVITDARCRAQIAATGYQLAAELHAYLTIGFSDWRQGGLEEHPELMAVAIWGKRCVLGEGPCDNPPLPAATPAPTPKLTPSGPGSIAVGDNTVEAPAGSAAAYAGLWRDGIGATSVHWHAACLTPGADCPDGDGDVSFGATQHDATLLFPVPAQSAPGHRYWHYTLSNPTNGATAEAGGNMIVNANDSSVNWLLPETTGYPGGGAYLQLRRGGALADTINGKWCLATGGTLTGSDLDYGAGSALLCDSSSGGWPWSLGAGQDRATWVLPLLSSAVSGHCGVLRFTGTAAGRIPECRVCVR